MVIKPTDELVKQVETLQRENIRLRGEVDGHRKRWQHYEAQYIVPCFDWAKQFDIDLHQLVRDNPGQNCIKLLIRELQTVVFARKIYQKSFKDDPDFRRTYVDNIAMFLYDYDEEFRLHCSKEWRDDLADKLVDRIFKDNK